MLQTGHTTTLACPIAPHALIAAITHPVTMPENSINALDHGWMFDRTARTIARHTVAHPLTEKESLLLSMLLSAAPAACLREALLKHIWAYEADIETHTLETHIYRLRQKLEALEPRPCDIETMDGAYRLVRKA